MTKGPAPAGPFSRPGRYRAAISQPDPQPPARPGLGTFAGVFTPSILTILGIILFLRLGFVVGNAGLWGSLLIIGIATLVSVLTSISLSAIATNIQVKGGGDYYLISRTLGAEFGGALGIVLFLAQSVSVAFYAIGFAEVTTGLLGFDEPIVTQFVALAAVLLLGLLAYAGADVATRFQFVIMAALVLALGSFYLGAVGDFELGRATDAGGPLVDGVPFWTVFAIFFPAVTGFTQGVSMSGDLRDPARSLPRGTFTAVGISTVVYVTAVFLLAGGTEQGELAVDAGEAMRDLSFFGPLVVAGVVAATLSSAMASFLGAPRILQSLAGDRIFPGLAPFARGSGPTGNPRRAVLLSAGIAIVTIGLGSLDGIAPVVSMFFLISYGLLNYATYFESRAKSPSFRPTFRFFHHRLSLAGTIAAVAVMLAINPYAAVAAAAVLYLLYRYVASKRGPDRWADATSAHHFQRAKESISALSAEVEHPRNWRPQIVSFSADPERRARLLRFSSWLEGGSGLAATFQIVQGEGVEARRETAQAQADLHAQIDELGLDLYGRAVLAEDALPAVPVIVQSFGLGRLGANTVLFGWPETEGVERRLAYVGALRELTRLGNHVVALASDAERWAAVEATPRRSRRIDVVWADNDTGRLALLMTYLCTRTRFWAVAGLRVVVSGDGADVRGVLDEARIRAEVVVIPDDDPGTIAAACDGASMVLVPMRLREGEMLDLEGRPLAPLMERLPLGAGILAGRPVDLVAQPDTGSVGELASAEQAVGEARRRLAILERQLATAESELGELSERKPGRLVTAEEVDAAEQRAEDVQRRVLKARVRLAEAEDEVEALTEAQRRSAGP